MRPNKYLENEFSSRIIGLDGLRGLLALIVAYSHAFGHLLGWNSDYRFMNNASFCVDVFFAMSGVVLYHAYSNRVIRLSDYLKFAYVRFFRLWPVHIVTMLLTLFVLYVGLGNPIPKWTKINGLSDILLDSTLTSALGIFGPGGSINQPAWSISIELWIGSLLMMLAFLRWYLLLPVLVFSSMQFLSNHIGSSEAGYKVYDGLSSGVWRCLISMSVGVVSYILFLSLKGFSNKKLSSFISSVAVVLIFVVTMGYHPQGLEYLIFVFVIGFGLVWLGDSKGWLIDILESEPIKKLGAYSFSLYLIHTPVIYIFVPIKTNGLYGILMAHISIVISVVISRYVYLNIEQKFSKKWSSSFRAGSQLKT